ncbi:MAG: hypothetical protein RLP14_02905 [Owenweeksia sp.]
MKKIILSFMAIFAICTAAMAQSAPLSVTNNTGCAFLVQLVNSDDACDQMCATSAICIPPGTTVINPCNANWYWDRALITPTTDDCQDCANGTIFVAAPNPTNCLGLSTRVRSNHCACGPYRAIFVSPTSLTLN